MQVLFAYYKQFSLPTEALVTNEKVDEMLHGGGIVHAHRVAKRFLPNMHVITWNNSGFTEWTEGRMSVHTIKGDGNCHCIGVGPPVRVDRENGKLTRLAIGLGCFAERDAA